MRRFLALLFVPILLCSCIDRFINPISDPRMAQIDERLIGTWIVEVEKEKQFLHIGKGEKNTMLFIAQSQKTPEQIESAKMFISRVDDRTFLNYEIPHDLASEYWGFLILEYEIESQDCLIIREINWDFVRKAVEDKRLSGEIEEDHVFVLAKSSEVRSFIKNSPKEKLFSESIKYNRLNF